MSNRPRQIYDVTLTPDQLDRVLKAGGTVVRHGEIGIRISVEFRDEEDLAEAARILEEHADDLAGEYEAVAGGAEVREP